MRFLWLSIVVSDDWSARWRRRQRGILVVDNPEKSDAIVVLAGETSARPDRALELLRQGFAPHLVLDAEAGERIYDVPLTGIAQKYASSLPEASPRRFARLKAARRSPRPQTWYAAFSRWERIVCCL